MLSCVSPRALRISMFDDAPSQCPKCYTPLLQGVIQLEEHPDVEEQILFCVTCRMNTVAKNDGVLEHFLEKSKGSLYLSSNPFEDNVRWAHYLRDKIYPYYKNFIEQNTLSGVNKSFNEAKIILSVYSGRDHVPINHLFVNARKVLVFLKLGEFFCQRIAKTNATQITQLEQAYTENSTKTRMELEQILPTLKKLTEELHTGKEKLVSFESKMNLFQAECTLKNDAVENTTFLLSQNENDFLLKKRYDDAVKAAKVALARLTISQHVYEVEKSKFDIKDREINNSILPLKLQLLDLEKAEVENKKKVQVSVETLKNLMAQTTPTLEHIQKAMDLIQEHMIAWAEAVFSSSYVMAKEVKVFEAICDCIKYIVRDYIPDTINPQDDDDNDMNMYMDDLLEMKVIQHQVATVPCEFCRLPILCNDNNQHGDYIPSCCVFCPQEIPMEPVDVTEHKDSSDENTEKASPDAVNESIAQTEEPHVESTTDENEIVHPMDAETMAEISKEAGLRILNGWILKEDLICQKCENQMMTDKSGKMSVCLLCDVVMQKEKKSVEN